MKENVCQFCGEKLNKNDIFCKECGAKIEDNEKVEDAIIDSDKLRKKDTRFLLIISTLLLVAICVITLLIILFKN